MVLALLFAAAAAAEFISTLQARPLIAFAASVERNGGEGPAGDDLLARVGAEIANREGCAQLLARSRVTASLFLFRQSTDAGVEEQRRTLALAAEQARQALACNPMDGNLWFVRGWLDHQLAPNMGLLREHIHAAIRFAPNERRALESRWLTLSPVLAELGLAHDDVLLADLERLYLSSRPRTVAAVHESLMSHGAAEIAAVVIARMPKERRTVLDQALESLASSLRTLHPPRLQAMAKIHPNG